MAGGPALADIAGGWAVMIDDGGSRIAVVSSNMKLRADTSKMRGVLRCAQNDGVEMVATVARKAL